MILNNCNISLPPTTTTASTPKQGVTKVGEHQAKQEESYELSVLHL